MAVELICHAALACGRVAFLIGRSWSALRVSAGDQALHPYRNAESIWARLRGRTLPRIVLTSHAATMRHAFEEVWWSQGGQMLAMFTGAPRLPLLAALDWRHFAHGEFNRCAREFTRAGAWCLAAPVPMAPLLRSPSSIPPVGAPSAAMPD